MTRFFSINDGDRLLVQNDQDFRMICPDKVIDAGAGAYRYVSGIGGECNTDEINGAAARELALKISGKPLIDLVTIK